MYAVSGDYQIPSCHLANHKSRVLLPFQSALSAECTLKWYRGWDSNPHCNTYLVFALRSYKPRSSTSIGNSGIVYRLSDMSRLSRVCSSLKFAQYCGFIARGIFKLNTLSDYVFCHNAVAVSGLSAVRTFTNCSPLGDQCVLNLIV